MKISIITVSYNAEQTIEHTINSVLMQNYSNIEYIIIDGKSKDKTVDIIKKYEDKITSWISEEDRGIYHAMNKGAKKTTGEYVLFLNADDALADQESIKKVVMCLKNKPDVLSASVWKVEGKRGLQKKWYVPFDPRGLLPHQGAFVKTDLVKKYLFNENRYICADTEFFLNCLRENRTFVFVDIRVCFFSCEGISSNIKNQTRIIEEKIKLFKDYGVDHELIKEYFNQNMFKEKIKWFLSKIGILEFVQYRKKIREGWTKHQCTNDKCRWCKCEIKIK